MSIDVVSNGHFELRGAGMGAALDGPLSNQPEPTLHLVKPGAAGRREVHMVARTLGQPVPDDRRLVGGIVVDNQTNVQLRRHFLVDAVEEFTKFDAPMAAMAFADDFAG